MRTPMVVFLVLLMTGFATPCLALTVTLPPNPTLGFQLFEYTDVAGIVMSGQTLSIDFLFATPFHLIDLVGVGSVSAAAQLYTAPHNPPNPNGDFPYSQYVVFGSGTVAYLLDETGNLLQTPMADFIHGGVTTAPAPTAPTILTDHGMAGAAMFAFLLDDNVIGGVNFDFVLPNTGQALVFGQIGVQGSFSFPTGEAPLALLLALGLGATVVLHRTLRRPMRPPGT